MSNFKNALKNMFRFDANRTHEYDALPPACTTLAAGASEKDRSLFVDSIYDHIEGKRPHGTPRAALRRLGEFINNGLKPGQHLQDGTYRTQFENIRATPDQLYAISLDNNVEVTRDRKEAKLHLLLQSQMHLVDALHVDNGASVYSSYLEKNFSKNSAARIPTSSASRRPLSFENPGAPAAKRWIPMNASQEDLAAIEKAASRNDTVHHSFTRNDDASARTDTRNTVCPENKTVNPLFSMHPDFSQVVNGVEPPSGNARPSGASMPMAVSAPLAAPAETASPAAFHQRAANDTGVRSFTDLYGNPTRIFSARAVDMQTVSTRLLGQSHLVKSISGAGAGCWWRGGMLAAIVQLEPAVLEATIVGKLGPDYAVQARQMRSMGEAYRREGLHTLATGMKLETLDADLDTPSRLKLPWMTDEEDNGAGEEACMQVIDALLNRAGVPDDERMNIIRGPRMGDLHHVACIVNQLECNFFVLNRPWASVGPEEPPRTDLLRSTVEICAQPGSRLANLALQGNRSGDSELLLNELDGVHGLVSGGGHFDFVIPSINIYLAPLRYPDRH